MFERVAKLINHQGAFGHVAEAALVCVMVERAIKKVVPSLSTEFVVKSFEKGVVKISFSSASASSEFQMNAKNILNETNQLLGSREVERFQYKIY